jgi:serine/threonine-protein kinase
MVNVSDSPKLGGMRYRVVKPLGTGAGSTILLISDKATGGKRYALKVVKRQEPEDEVYLDQARLEFEVAQKLNHPVIAKIYDCRTRRSWFRVSGVDLLMEYVEGQTLDEVEAPELSQLVLVFIQVASALTHMHRRGVFHGDLKPSNIMLSKSGQVKLIDFGTAWIRGQDKNRVQGTPQFMAPEQVTEKVVDERTDLYNLGATMYRMFTGRFAHAGLPKTGDASTRKLAPPSQINSRIPKPLSDLIMTCMEISPDRRPEGMFEVQQQLTAIAQSMGLEGAELKGASDEV